MFPAMLTRALGLLVPVALALGTLACAAEPDLASLVARAREATNAGRLDDAVGLWGSAVRAAEKGGNDTEIRDALTGLGEVEQALGRNAEAIETFRRVAAAHQRVVGAQDVSLARAYDRIALLYQESGQLAEALAEYEKSIAIREAALGRSAPEVAETLNNMGLVAYLQGDLDRAQKLLGEAVGNIDNARIADNPNRAMALTNLAQVHRARGDVPRAIELFREAVRVWKLNLGPEAERVALSQNNLAEALRSAGQLAEAEALYRSSLGVLERVHAADAAIAATLSELGVVLRRAGRPGEAEPVLRRAVGIEGAAAQVNRAELGTTRFNLALALDDLKRPAESTALYESALADLEAAGSPASTVGRVLERWAAAARAAGDTTKAAELERRIAECPGD